MPMRMAGPPLRRLVNSLHLHSIHSTTVNREARDSRLDFAKIGRRQLSVRVLIAPAWRFAKFLTLIVARCTRIHHADAPRNNAERPRTPITNDL
jgi:hypothetical protein